MTLRVAVVGSGPAGFYAAGHLLDADLPVEVDMLERLPTPWGLVRLGVAPDHPKIKAVSKAFERIAAQPGFRFLGGVEVGRDLTHEDLARAVRRRRLRSRRADRPADGHSRRGSARLLAGHRVRRLVQRPPRLPGARRSTSPASGRSSSAQATSRSTSSRMLALAPEEIRPTDTTDEAIEAILGSGIEEIVLLARRGPAQAAFTTPELKELGELADADVVVDPADLELDPASEAVARARHERAPQRRGAARVRGSGRRPGSGVRSACASAVSPVAILGDGSGRGDRDRPQPAGRRRERPRERRADGRARDDSVRDRLPQRRLSRCRACRASRSTRGARRFRTRTAASPPSPGRLLRRLDQARPERRDRHEQEGRDRDGRPPARGRACRTAAARRPGGDRRDGGAAARRPRRRARHLCRLGGDRRRGARPRRAARPPPREARRPGANCSTQPACRAGLSLSPGLSQVPAEGEGQAEA